MKIIGKSSIVRVWTPLCQGFANISVKGQIINILSLQDTHIVSAAGMKAAIDNR